jgi:hypothetical protein
MKKKIYKLLGVALTATLLASLMIGLGAVPASADPGNRWSDFDTPSSGQRGDWFMDDDLIAGTRIIKQAIDGTLGGRIP